MMGWEYLIKNNLQYARRRLPPHIAALTLADLTCGWNAAFRFSLELLNKFNGTDEDAEGAENRKFL